MDNPKSAPASLPASLPEHRNRLADETSPYLLQHAFNPVDWYPWGPEAIEEARRREVPIFLSIGYSTCYWCHVMERESFEDEATAAVMNERFVCVKVDREERPDIDDVYMAATQMMTGHGGWPMSAFLEPQHLRPFYCGTYFPPEPRHGLASFTQVLLGISDAFEHQRSEVFEQAESVADGVRQHLSPDEPRAVTIEHVRSAAGALLQTHDRVEGGFGGAPKFPQPVYLLFLLDVLDRSADGQTTAAVEGCLRLTLDRMAAGGLFDHAGGGFHRYCVDGTWTVPHFEKMLYDNAQLAEIYARAGRRFDDDWYRQIVRRTLGFVQREMTAAEGGFASALDAEVDGKEGLNYLWTEAEVRELLADDDAEFAVEVYGLSQTNFKDPHHPEEPARNVLRLEHRPERVAEKLGLGLAEFSAKLDAVNAALLRARDERKQPHRDDKVITAWNGMMIGAIARASVALDDPSLLEPAKQAAAFVLDRLHGEQGLARTYRAGKTTGVGVLEDSAYLIDGLLALHEADPDRGWLAHAEQLWAEADARFADAETGGLYDTASDGEELFVRPRTTYDGAVPSGASVMLNNACALVRHHPDQAGVYAKRAVEIARAISAEIATQPVSCVNSTRAVMHLLDLGEIDGRPIADLLAEAPDAPPPASPAPAGPRPVRVLADLEKVRVTPESPVEVRLVLEIDDGWHVLAADPVPESSDIPRGLIPLRVGLISGQGVAVYAEYPEGEPYGGAFAESDEADLLVHHDRVELRVVLERKEGVGAGPGEPVLGVTVQPCTDDRCVEPVTLPLGIEVELD